MGRAGGRPLVKGFGVWANQSRNDTGVTERRRGRSGTFASRPDPKLARLAVTALASSVLLFIEPLFTPIGSRDLWIMGEPMSIILSILARFSED
jgi:hypothetical protein